MQRMWQSIIIMSLACVLAGLASAQVGPQRHTDGGIGDYTPLNYFSNGEVVNLTNGNFSRTWTGPAVPGRGGRKMAYTATVVTGDTTLRLDQFSHRPAWVWNHAVNNQGKPCTKAGCKDQRVGGKVISLQYLDKNISIPGLGMIRARYDADAEVYHNTVEYDPQESGWDVSWADVRGVIVATDLGYNRSDARRYAYLVLPGGVLESIRIGDGRSEVPGSTLTVLQKLGDNAEQDEDGEWSKSDLPSLKSIESLEVLDTQGLSYTLRRNSTEWLPYKVTYRERCGHLFWVKDCDTTYTLDGWRFDIYALESLADRNGNKITANPRLIDPGETQTLTLALEDGEGVSEPWQHISRERTHTHEIWTAPGMVSARTWQLHYDEQGAVTTLRDAEQRTTQISYDAQQSYESYPAVRRLGLGQLQDPTAFIHIVHPSGGALRYEQFATSDHELAFVRHAIVTEIPDLEDAETYYQRYYRVRAATSEEDDADDLVHTAIYMADGAQRDVRYSKRAQRLVIDSDVVNSHGEAESTLYQWAIAEQGDDAHVQGVAAITRTQNGLSYTERSFSYDAADRVVSETDAIQDTVQYSYLHGADAVLAARENVLEDAAAHNVLWDQSLITAIDRTVAEDQRRDVYGYGEQHNCADTQQAHRLTSRKQYVNNALIEQQQICYDAFGNVRTERSGTQSPYKITTRHYDSDKVHPIEISTGDEQATTVAYDPANGLLITEQSAASAAREYQYNLEGQLTRIDYGNGYAKAHDYQLVGAGAESNQVRTTEYAPGMAPLEIVRHLDGLGLVRTMTRSGEEWQYGYDVNRRVQSIQYPGGQSMGLRYDGRGRVVEKILSGIESLRYEYRLASQGGTHVYRKASYLGHDAEPFEVQVYNLRGDLIEHTRFLEGVPVTTRYDYDALHHLRSVQSPTGAFMQRDVAWADRTVTRRYSSGESIVESDLSGDGLPQLLSYADATSNQVRSTQIEYDAERRARTLHFTDAAGVEQQTQITYGAADSNAAQRVAHIEDTYGTTAFWYGGHGQVAGVERQYNALDAAYNYGVERDAYGNITRMLYPHGLALVYHRDSAQRVLRVTKDDADGMILVEFDYTARGDVAEVRYANGVRMQYTYDAAGRVQRIYAAKNAQVLLDEQYVYDRYGNKTRVTHADGSRAQFTYNTLNYLTKAQYFRAGEDDAFASQSYTYDAAGNRLSYSDDGQSLSYTLGIGPDEAVTNQIVSYQDGVRTAVLRYALGNIVEHDEAYAERDQILRDYHYDSAGRLEKVDITNAQTNTQRSVHYQYDYRGRRESRTVAGDTLHFGYGDHDEPLVEINAAGEVVRSHVYVGGQRIAVLAGDELQFYHSDELGNTRALTDANATLVQSVRYDPFGNITFLQGKADNPYLYAGKYWDRDAELVDFGRRSYDPKLGRFIQRDPFGQGANHYTYVANNPLIRRDVQGLFFASFGSTEFNPQSIDLIHDTGGSVPELSSGPVMPLPGTSPSAHVQGSAAFAGFAFTAILYGVNQVLPVPDVVNHVLGSVFGHMQTANDFADGADKKKEDQEEADEECGESMSCISELTEFELLFGFANGQDDADAIAGGQSPYEEAKQDFLADTADSGAVAVVASEAVNTVAAFPSTTEDPETIAPQNSATPEASVVANLGDLPDKPTATVQETAAEVSTMEQLNNVSDPVLLHSGDFLQSQTDLRIAGRGLDYQFKRTYRSRVQFNGPLGHGWDHNYNKHLVVQEPNEAVDGDLGGIARFDGTARFDIYALQADGSYKTPYGRFDVLRKHSDGSYSIRDRYGDVQRYDTDGVLLSISDASGNLLQFSYADIDGEQRLSVVHDSLGRDITYQYHQDGPQQGLLKSVEDFTGRVVQFSYSTEGDLAVVTSPATEAFPEGRSTIYTYSKGYPEDQAALNHNLLTVTDAAGNVYLENTYTIFDRVARQRFGDLGEFSFDYRQLSKFVTCDEPEHADLAMYRTKVRDRSGNETLWDYNCQGNPLRKEEFTRSIRSDDPASYVTTYRYDLHGQLLEETKPLGNSTQYEYEDVSAAAPTIAAWSAGNLRRVQQTPDAVRGGGDPLVTEYQYEPIYNRPISVTDPAQATTQLWYDYQEGTATASLAAQLGLEASDLTPLLSAVPLQQGDLNGDARTDQAAGRLVRVDAPDTTGLDDVAQQHRRRFQYNDHGQLLRHIDGAGVATRLDYADGYVQQVLRDETGLQVSESYTRDARGNITAVSNANGTTHYNYTALDQVALVTDALGAETRYRYNANTKIAQIDRQHLLADGTPASDAWVSTQFGYNMLDRVQVKREEVEADRYVVTEYHYDANENVARVIQPEGNSIVYTYDERDYAHTVTQGAGSANSVALQYHYDANGNLLRETNALGESTRYQYDGFDRQIAETDPRGAQQLRSYDARGLLLSEQNLDPDEVLLAETRYSYDALGRRVTQQNANIVDDTITAWRSSQYGYDQQHNLTTSTDPLGAVTQTVYDSLGRVAQQIDAELNAILYSYDALGNVLTRTDRELHAELGPVDHVTQFSYDVLSRQLSRTDPAGRTWSYAYDSLGRMTRTSDAKDSIALDAGANAQSGNIVRYGYDGLGRQTHIHTELRAGGVGTGLLEDTLTTEQRWDDNSRLIGIIDAAGNETTYTYDAVNRRTHTAMPDGAEYVVHYDDASRMHEFNLPNGTSVEMTYDGAGNLIQRDLFASGNPQGRERLSYDYRNRLTTAVVEDVLGNDAHVLNYQYDSFDNVVQEDQHGHIMQRSYNAQDVLQQLQYASGQQLTYVRDQIGRLTAVQDSAAQAVASYGYAGKNRRASVNYANQTSADFTYDPTRRLAQYHWQQGDGSTIAQHNLYYDQVGNLVLDAYGGTDDAGDVYHYDSLYRLANAAQAVPNALSAYGPDAPSDFGTKFSYSYDEAHNRSSQSVQAGPEHAAQVTAFERNALNQYVAELLSAENQPDQERSYVYDANGNLREDDVYRYTYNWRNLITDVHWLSDGQLAARYAYDALGRRVSKYDASNGTVTQFIYDGWQVLEERDGAGNLLASYTYAELDTPISMTRGEATYYYHTNHQGSVIAMSGVDGTVIERYSYDPFGTVSITLPDGAAVGSSQIDNPYFYTARRYDSETDLYHYRHRYYSARLGRFLQRDPLGYVDGENLYAYVQSNPLNATDPYGLTGNRLYEVDYILACGGQFGCMPSEPFFDGTLDIPESVPLIGGARFEVSTNATLANASVSWGGERSLVTIPEIGLSLDLSYSYPKFSEYQFGALEVELGPWLGGGVEFSVYKDRYVISGLSLSFGKEVTMKMFEKLPLQFTVSDEYIEEIVSMSNREYLQRRQLSASERERSSHPKK